MVAGTDAMKRFEEIKNEFEKDYIPKSKVREKIEELENQMEKDKLRINNENM